MSRALVALIPVLLILAQATVAAAQVNLTITPDAPQAVESGLGKALGLGVVLVAAGGVLALLWGGFKLATGQEGAGRWLVGGAAALIIAYAINDIVAWLTTP